MVLVTHILLAVISVIYSSYAAISPSKAKLHITFWLALGTIVSGLVVTLSNPAHLGQTCIKGAIYMGFILVTSFVSRKRLA